ncbi:ADP-ribosylglycohydrolase family protein [Cladophialophora carrionii]|uniref:ADP-ribosylhydrolase ARH3 n=1 Tax=Cladophialophora carrionii TaxID=86049 RepID=A0A1C1CRF7_9EURO|nr:ADP-ribosylglycohydrolase family protein [Cladophialophora carrionii]
MVDQVKKYISWWQNGYMSSTGSCFDIGVSTRSALQTWADMLHLQPRSEESPMEGAHSAMLTKITREFSKDEYCGNGSLMRVLPAALIASSASNAVELAKESSLPTHPHPRCVHACMIYASLVQQALNGASKTELAISLSESINEIPSNISDTPIEAVLAERIGRYRSIQDWKRTTADSIRSTGYVVDSLEAALWAFFNSDTFAEAAIQAVNLGYDSDTVGAICGGIAGTYYGFDAIRDDWLRDLKKKELLDEATQKIIDHRKKLP